jgi:high-affinity nickel permease
MFGLDSHIAHFSDGVTLLLVIGVAVLLGLRHATDPDHLAAVTTLIASKKEHTRRLAAKLGFSWGLGHASSLFAFGLPIVLYRAYLPGSVLEVAETLIGLMIIGLALWLLVRWRRGIFHLHAHEHEAASTIHLHGHAGQPDHAHSVHTRSPFQAYAIGVVHGMGGSAGVGILLLATIHSHAIAVVALALFAFFTAISMALLSSGFGLALSSARVRRSFHWLAPVLGSTSFAFGVWYALGALRLAPYYF